MRYICFNIKNLIFDFVFKSSARIILITFLLLCLFGGFILSLPCCGNISLVDAMFTSFSGVCVTGLSTIDISNDLTFLGQIVLLILIQIGGLSIMSISSLIFFLLGKKMSLSYEKNARNIFNVDSREEIKESLYTIFKYTFVIETIGTLILSCRLLFFSHDFLYAIWNGVFLAISAFCNAGFTLFQNNLISHSNDPIIILTISFLIILGGIAPAIAITFSNFLRREKLSPMVVIVFNVTIILLFFGTFIFFISEYNNTLSNLNIFDKLVNSWFQSVTTRTAGFNSIEIGKLNPSTYILFLFLMTIGGSPGGMAGGIKTTTLGLFFVTCYNTVLGQKNIIRNKEISPETIYTALSLILLYVSVIIIATLILTTTQEIPYNKLLFEVVSAMGTVGLSMDITTKLDTVGKIVIGVTMFLGRILPAIFICHVNSNINKTELKYPQAKILLT